MARPTAGTTELDDQLLGTSPAETAELAAAGKVDPVRRERLLVPRQGTRAGAVDRVPAWQRSYIQKIIAVDAGVAALAAFLGYFARFNVSPANLSTTEGQAVIAVAVLLPVLWVLAMGALRTYEARFLGVGSEEYHRVLTAGLSVIALVGTTSYAFALDIARGFVVVAFPLAIVMTLIGRYAVRQQLHRSRTRGEAAQAVVAVGHRAAVAGMARQLHRASYHGMRIVGACVPGGKGSALDDAELIELGIPVIGSLEDVRHAVTSVDADVVAVTACPELDGPALRRLGWDLEATRADLVVAPALTEVIGPRVAIRPVCGLPLLHVERPELRGVRRVAKELFDRSVAGISLLLLSPLLLGLALAIRLDSKGPALFRQERVGKDGRLFTMYKFRSMVTDAERLLVDLRESSEGNGVLFKMKVDPRITRIGRVLRKFSLDEFPQLINVFLGQMSLVGPRPPLQREVDEYGSDMRRRLLVKPGLTGLWQINGRSDLDWDESVRLDVRYVENWSFTFDFMILWKTAGAVFRGRGAY